MLARKLSQNRRCFLSICILIMLSGCINQGQILSTSSNTHNATLSFTPSFTPYPKSILTMPVPTNTPTNTLISPTATYMPVRITEWAYTPYPPMEKPLFWLNKVSYDEYYNGRQKLPDLRKIDFLVPFPNLQDKIMVYRQPSEDWSVGLKPEQAEDVADKLGLSCRCGVIDHRYDDGSQVLIVRDGTKELLVWQYSPLYFNYDDNAIKYDGIAPLESPSIEQQKRFALSFLQLHHLLNNGIELIPFMADLPGRYSWMINFLIDGKTLIYEGPTEWPGRIDFDNKGNVSYLGYKLPNITKYREYPMIGADKAWDNILSGPPDKITYRFYDPQYQPDSFASPVNKAVIEKSDLIYFAFNIDFQSSFYTAPDDNVSRFILPIWRFTGINTDGHRFEIFTDAILNWSK